MALKALLFLLAFVLLVSTKVGSTEESILLTQRHHHYHAKAQAHAPVKPPVHSSKNAPIYPPKEDPTPPKMAPAYPPKILPVHPPSKHHNHGNCIQMCLEYCKQEKQSKRGCMRICVPCCDEYKCVPGPYNKCTNWKEVKYDGKSIKCPKY